MRWTIFSTSQVSRLGSQDTAAMVHGPPALGPMHTSLGKSSRRRRKRSEDKRGGERGVEERRGERIREEGRGE